MTDIDLKSAEEAADRYDGLGVPMSAYQPQIAEMRNRAGLPTKPVSAARSTAPEAGKAVGEIAKIIDPHSFMDIPFTDDPVLLDMVEQSKQDAIRKAERILSALASSPAPTGAEPVAWMVLRKGNLHLPVLTSKEDAEKYQRFNPEETLQALYAEPAAPQAVLADERWKAIFIERLKAL